MFLFSLPLYLSTFAVLSSTQVLAWQVDVDCSFNSAGALLAGLTEPSLQLGNDLARHVSLATLEAQSIAMYMAKKALMGPRVGNLMQDLLGAPSEDDSETLAWIGTSVTNIIAAMNVPSTNEGGGTGLIIKCTDSHLTPIDPLRGIFRDKKRKNVRVQVPRIGTLNPQTACGYGLQGFTYGYPGGQVIVLCSDSPWGAAKVYNEVTLNKWRHAGDLRLNPLVISKGVDGMAGALSVKLLHELFHVGGIAFQQAGGTGTPNQFPGTLPEKEGNARISEVYTWKDISGKNVGSPETHSKRLSHKNALHNADSMALLGAGWYVPNYGWVDGACKTVKKANRSPLQYDGQGIPAAPDGYGGFENIDSALYPEKRAIPERKGGGNSYGAFVHRT
ncbi:uncharacterized protein BP5553_00206 [Venustampulla echinocandica]|uniref:Lysine-specific metallo-endopeptidase domain-containing protein n=1 Tax=Venustampulla echinocandica TaxID=2656787 RepID=A0A370TXH2_9HELO|nr:uncharacterized protein BP5553_00206 [Venustampulla echinocandica]RDL40227.1 hypothetical protein BP5553_00206 [Venustampulla echinocandica]